MRESYQNRHFYIIKGRGESYLITNVKNRLLIIFSEEILAKVFLRVFGDSILQECLYLNKNKYNYGI